MALEIPAAPLPTPLDPAQARRNLFALTAASFIGFTGFTLVMPFLPLYIAQLGVTDVGQIAVWTGVSLGVTPAVTALLAPAWGRLADRFGRKLLVVRSLVSFVVLMSVMALVWKPWHVLALRAVQGVFAGYGALCLAMAADSAPPGRFAQSIGMVQTAQRLGPALGPVLGGIVAGSVGLRTSFYVTAVFYAAALAQLVVLYREPPAAASDGRERLERVTFRNVLVFENFMLVMGLIFAFQFVDRSFGPVLPLHVAHLGTPEGRVAFVSGLLFSLIACAAAGGHHVCARLLDEWPVRTVITRATLLAGGAAIVFVAADSLWLLAIACVVFGFGIGVATTAAYTVAATVVPGHARGAGFGLLTSSSLIGMALSPIVSGFVGATGIRFVFAADAAVLAAVAIAVRRLMIDTSAASAGPVNEDA